MDRRTHLKQVAGIVTLATAGCSESSTPTTGPPTSPAATSEPTRTPTATGESEDTETPSESATPTATPRPEVAAEVAVGTGDGFQFDPESVTVSVGDTIRWVWETRGHNVKPGDIPADADWTGTPGDEGETFQSEYVYAYTFEVAGTYDYYCAPHESFGMTGSFTVE